MIAIKRDKVLLKKAKSIFGSIIKNAYVAINTYDNETTEEIRGRLKFCKLKEDNKKDIVYDKIVLEFTNGKSVMFSTNEDAWMEPTPTIKELS